MSSVPCAASWSLVSQPYAPLLFGTTSMHDLLVAQHSEIEWGHDMLRIASTAGTIVRFTLHEQPWVKPATWQCTGSAVLETFERFLRLSKWVNLGAPSPYPARRT